MIKREEPKNTEKSNLTARPQIVLVDERTGPEGKELNHIDFYA